jgi:hypothetical protein
LVIDSGDSGLGVYFLTVGLTEDAGCGGVLVEERSENREEMKQAGVVPMPVATMQG